MQKYAPFLSPIPPHCEMLTSQDVGRVRTNWNDRLLPSILDSMSRQWQVKWPEQFLLEALFPFVWVDGS